MKHLKYINENWQEEYANEETDNLVQSIQDICLELEDEGYHVQVNKMLPNSDRILVYFKYKTTSLKKENVRLLSEIISRIKDMMKDAGWYLGDTVSRFNQSALTFTKEKEKEYVTFGDGTAHTNF